jgi:probable RNA-binding protein EIF1AD
MSGSKRKSQYRKSVTTNYLQTNITLEEGDEIARIICSRGANLFEIEISNDLKNGLGLLPNKFRNLIWIKRNDFVIVTITSQPDNNEVVTEAPAKSSGADSQSSMKRYEVKEILNAEHIKHLKSSNQWPSKFKDLNFGTGVKAAENIPCPEDDEEEEEEEVLTDRFGNSISKSEAKNVLKEERTSELQFESEQVIPVLITKDIVDNTNTVESTFEVDYRGDYEEEEEDDDGRNVEYEYDGGPEDMCCLNSHPTPEDVTCSLCTVKS